MPAAATAVPFLLRQGSICFFASARRRFHFYFTKVCGRFALKVVRNFLAA